MSKLEKSMFLIGVFFQMIPHYKIKKSYSSIYISLNNCKNLQLYYVLSSASCVSGIEDFCRSSKWEKHQFFMIWDWLSKTFLMKNATKVKPVLRIMGSKWSLIQSYYCVHTYTNVDPRLGQTKDIKIGISCFFVKHAAVRS